MSIWPSALVISFWRENEEGGVKLSAASKKLQILRLVTGEIG
jgi:hypothetical protein